MKGRILILVLALTATAFAQHEHPAPPQQAQPQQHQHDQAGGQPAVQADPAGSPLPPIGGAQAASALTLEQLEQMALKNNPTLGMAAAEVRAARGRRTQAGLLPNPTVGYTGEEIRGGSFRGGQHGAFVEQTIVLGGKLGHGRKVFEQEIRIAEVEQEEQRLRVVNSVRLAYYKVLEAQELLTTEKAFVRVAADTLETSKRLFNLGQQDETEVLQAEVELQRAELAAIRQENQLRRLWAALAALTGNTDLPLTPLAGQLDAALPPTDAEAAARAIVERSPAVRIAEVNVERADATVSRARRESIPDLQLRAGLQQNRERLESGRPAGLQGFAEVGIQLPIFNRNQGNVEAARAELERARQEHQRVRLLLHERAAALVQRLENARVTAGRYREQIVPRADRAYQAMLRSWGQMAASYPQVLMAQRTLFDVRRDYIGALGELWASSIALEGFMLTDGLEAPARPGEVDLPVREINIPTTRGGGE